MRLIATIVIAAGALVLQGWLSEVAGATFGWTASLAVGVGALLLWEGLYGDAC